MEQIVYGAFAIEAALFIYAFVAFFREKSALRNFVETATQPERLKDVAKQLPPSYRAPATQFAGDLSRKGHLDEILSYAITKTANTPFGFGPFMRVIVASVAAAIVFSPLTTAMMQTATQISETRARTQPLAGAQVFKIAKNAMDPAFETLQWAFMSSALLLAGIVVVGALHWWLNRAEAREARFVIALIEAAIIARPGSSAPVTGRLTELIAPDRSLRIPILAFTFFFAAAGAGWALLYLTAGIKEANAAGVYAVWPKENRKEAVAGGSKLGLPMMQGGGSPIRSASNMTLAIETTGAGYGERRPIVSFENNQPKADWQKTAPDYTEELNPFRNATGQLDLFVLADENVPVRLVLDLLDYSKTKYASSRVYLVFRRTVAFSGERSTPFQSQIQLDLTRPAGTDPPWMKILIDGSRILINPSSERAPEPIDRKDPNWRATLSKVIAVLAPKQQAGVSSGWIEIQALDRALPWGQFLDVLSAADNTCSDQRDCGVPGLGLQFLLGQ